MLTRDRVCELVEHYGAAWANKDVESLSEIFTEDALYIENPSRFFEGVEEIKKYWSETICKQEGVEFRHIVEDMIFDGESLSATVKWEAAFERGRRENPNGTNNNSNANNNPKPKNKGVWCVIMRFRQENGTDLKVCWFEEFWHKIRDPQEQQNKAQKQANPQKQKNSNNNQQEQQQKDGNNNGGRRGNRGGQGRNKTNQNGNQKGNGRNNNNNNNQNASVAPAQKKQQQQQQQNKQQQQQGPRTANIVKSKGASSAFQDAMRRAAQAAKVKKN